VACVHCRKDVSQSPFRRLNPRPLAQRRQCGSPMRAVLAPISAGKRLGLAPLVRLAARRVPDPLNQRWRVRVQLFRPIDGFALRLPNGACPLRIRSPHGIVALWAALDELGLYGVVEQHKGWPIEVDRRPASRRRTATGYVSPAVSPRAPSV
jgi:hypothetical protein